MVLHVVPAIISVLLIVGTLFVSIRYANQYSDPKRINKQHGIVKQNRQTFGISEAKAPEIQDVHIVKYDDLGING